MGACSAILVVLITILFPPVGVAIVAGCGADLLINIALTILGYFPGHIHAFYLEYVYYSRLQRPSYERAPGIFSPKVQNAGQGQERLGVNPQQAGYGTVPQQQGVY
ncbi:hypothetical protein F5Y16DRAFT_397960 [Xylariaceae sp. FL0255]|nr:hypothetical protein F5Y16DRAFT_397960 [Xylariaceae sp. FL0255]